MAFTLSRPILRNLGDRSYEKRKQAALEIEQIIKDFNPALPSTKDRVRSVIHIVVNEYAYSTQPNSRKGGLIGLSAVAVALLDDASLYLELLLPPVLKCFGDPESRVRYYACEAMYNITKVVRGYALTFFNEIFDGLCKLYADADVDVKSGAQLLDRLVKDVVAESTAFDVERFIPLLRERIRIRNPFIRQLIIGWISLLDSLPDVDMLEFLPEYLGGLLDMLGDPNKDIRQQAYSALAGLLRQISLTPEVDLGSMLGILIQQCDARDSFTRVIVLTWIQEFLHMGKHALLPYTADILSAVLSCISDPEREIRQKAQRCNEILLRLVEEADISKANLDLKLLLGRILLQLSNCWVAARSTALRWIAMLLLKSGVSNAKESSATDLVTTGTALNDSSVSIHNVPELFSALLRTLLDTDENVVRLDLQVIARLCTTETISSTGARVTRVNQVNFDLVIVNLLRLFAQDVRFLEQRGSLIIRQLTLLLNAEVVFKSISKLLVEVEDIDFVSLFVQTLNLILLTAPELSTLRTRLKNSQFTKEGRALFSSLFKPWCCSPVAALSLSLLAQAYDLSHQISLQIADSEMTVGTLVQLDRLIQLIESPILVHIRLHLLEAETYKSLPATLFTILMLIPQSSAFTSLNTRIAAALPATHMKVQTPVECATTSKAPVRDVKDKKSKNKDTESNVHRPGYLFDEIDEYLSYFQRIQQQHSKAREDVARAASILSIKDEESSFATLPTTH